MDAISTISGLISAASFVDGSATATGAAVVAEFAQLINKTNEVVDGLTEVAAQADESTDDVVLLEGRMATAEEDISALQSSAGDLEVNGDVTLTAEQVHDKAMIYCNKTGVATTMRVTLPATREAGTRSIAIYNNGFTTVAVGAATVFRTGSGIGESATGDIQLVSGATLIIAPDPVGAIGHIQWSILYGADISDVVTE